MRTRLILAAVAAAASLTACGSAGEPSTDNREATARKAMLDYARCMREHGIDMPDPQFDGGRVMMRAPRDVDPEEMRAAEEQCEQFRDELEPPELSSEQREEMREAALAHSKCMREHGVNFPDPTFDENGGAQIRIDRSSGIDPESPQFMEAQKACQDKMPAGPSTTDVEENR